MARKKVEPTLIVKDWDQADDTLRQIGELELLKNIRESRANLAINEIKDTLKLACNPIVDEIERLDLGLKAFCEAEYAKKSYTRKVLNFGSVFFRQRSSLQTLKGFTWKKVAEIMAGVGLQKYLKVSTSVIKDDLRNSKMSDQQLAAVGTYRHSERPFTYELDEEKFERTEITDPAPFGSAASA